MDPCPQITVRPLTGADRAAVGRLYARAFPDKVASMLRTRADRAGEVMADFLTPSPNIWVAEMDGVLAGLAWTQDRLRPGPKEETWKILRRHLPLPGALRAWFFCFLLHGVGLGPNDLYVDSLAVDPDYEGRGVARALVDHVVAEARRRRKKTICLYVIDRNHHARDVYLHCGFEAVHTERLRFFDRVVGFGLTDFMELALDGGPGASRDDERQVGNWFQNRFEAWVWRREPPPGEVTAPE